MFTRLIRFGFALALFVGLSACNLPAAATDEAQEPPLSPELIAQTSVAATLSAIGTASALAPIPPVPATATETPSPLPSTETGTPSPTAIPQNPLVMKDALCWEGPGPAYEVVSSVKKDARVQLLGRGSIGAWWIIDNPIYHDPCWLQADVLQLDVGYDLTNLKVFNPPPTPTATATHTRTPTPIVISP